MTHDEILQGLFDNTLVGNAPEVKDLVNQGLEDGLGPESMLYDALIPSLEEVGARFERGDYFVPEMLIAARAMQGALDILRPLLAETDTAQVGTFLMGTVKGDVHDIGKNLCNIMLEGAGFTVIDLGVNVPPERFVEQIEEHNPDIVGFSAFLTTTMPMFKANINALEKAGMRDKVIVMVGGSHGRTTTLRVRVWLAPFVSTTLPSKLYEVSRARTLPAALRTRVSRSSSIDSASRTESPCHRRACPE